MASRGAAVGLRECGVVLNDVVVVNAIVAVIHIGSDRQRLFSASSPLRERIEVRVNGMV